MLTDIYQLVLPSFFPLFYTLTPVPTCQLKCSQRRQITIPERNAEELTAFHGQHSKTRFLQVFSMESPVNIIMVALSYHRVCQRKIASLSLCHSYQRKKYVISELLLLSHKIKQNIPLPLHIYKLSLFSTQYSCV